MEVDDMEYSLFIQYDTEDEIYVASIPELSGCIAHGKTKEEAIKELDIAKELWIENAKAHNQPIPKPSYYKAIA